MTEAQKGVLALVTACVTWGLSSIFYKALSDVPPAEVLAHRTLWSLVFFSGVLMVQGRLSALWAAVTGRASLGVIALAAVTISTNWFFFIWSIQIGRATEASMGYYIFPLVAVLFGRVFFSERLSRAQWVAVGLAGAAVLTLTFGLRIVPFVPLVLASTFGFYGVLKKRLDLGPVVSVTAEVFLLAPIALAWLGAVHMGGGGVYGTDPVQSAMLMFSGPLTGMPLMLFAYGARRLAMATVGVVQYINPTLQFTVAVAIFGEPFGAVHLAAFALIWTALALYSASAFRQDKARRRARMVSEAEIVVSTKSSSEASAKP
ncbi:EamA family transporter RarD [Marivita sp. GX14005]|uniref:EamA family transporter RarD n=1 Tax=Marivita sp. GX14005 TaxID=2942276 RepID=UPI0020187225|nr:EamA family transporter RarD [Marivita sp. GX14005]MCL3882893.1 EamA family transporter RarD [Marivita sp. GX14005]